MEEELVCVFFVLEVWPVRKLVRYANSLLVLLVGSSYVTLLALLLWGRWGSDLYVSISGFCQSVFGFC
jgi:hypothetical protein